MKMGGETFSLIVAVSTGVPHIVLHLATRTSGGYFKPSEVRFRGMLALSGDLSNMGIGGWWRVCF